MLAWHVPQHQYSPRRGPLDTSNPWKHPMRKSGRDWNKWDRFEWSEALLEHYFGIAHNTDPVRALVVVGAELAHVVGDPEATSDEVEKVLVSSVLRGVGPNNFWNHAKDAEGSRKPYYLAHLIVACLAATELDDVDENSYIARLADMTGSARGDLNLEVMAQVWRHLAIWLDERPDEYRHLVLPNPGGWTRIGYAVKLAFPSRHDQRALVRVLSSRNLMVEEPPVGLVVDAVIASKKSAFSDRFWQEFNKFRRERESGQSSGALGHSPFWLAVRATAGADVRPQDETVHWALLASDDGFDVDLQVVSDGRSAGGIFDVIELEETIGRWTHEARGSPTEHPAMTVLDGGCSLPGLSQLVRGGLIPLLEEVHGNLESNGRRESLPDVDAALVSDSLAREAMSRFGSKRCRRRSCGVTGWSFVEGLRLHVVDSGALRGTPLENCWILHESLGSTRILPFGGVRVGSAWLGVPQLLPKFRMDSATAMTGRSGGTAVSLRQQGAGAWELPARAFDGQFEVVAEVEGRTVGTRVEFVGSPPTECFKEPGSPESWVFEDQGRSRPFANRWSEDTPEIREIADVEPTVYLGRDVGVFLDGPEGAAWAVVEVGETRIIRPLGPLSDRKPQGQVPDRGARRRWRKMLSVDAVTACEPQTATTLRRIVANTRGQKDLPNVATHADGRKVPSARRPAHPRLAEVITATVAMSNQRAGFDRRSFMTLLCESFAIEPDVAWLVTRGWQEAGLLDELVNVRWSGRKLLAVSPHLCAFRTSSGVRATYCGLSLPVTGTELASTAAGMGMAVSSVESSSPFVPKTTIVQASSLDQIAQLGASQRLPLRFISADPFLSHDGRDLGTHPPQVGYRQGHPERVGPTVEMVQNWQRGAPSFWTIRSRDVTTWTHFRDAATFWARLLAGTLEVDIRAPASFTLGDVRMPLAAARWLSYVGGARSGPTGRDLGDPYLYSAPTPAVRDRMLDGLRRFEIETIQKWQQQSEGDLSHV